MNRAYYDYHQPQKKEPTMDKDIVKLGELMLDALDEIHEQHNKLLDELDAKFEAIAFALEIIGNKLELLEYGDDN